MARKTSRSPRRKSPKRSRTKSPKSSRKSARKSPKGRKKKSGGKNVVQKLLHSVMKTQSKIHGAVVKVTSQVLSKAVPEKYLTKAVNFTPVAVVASTFFENSKSLQTALPNMVGTYFNTTNTVTLYAAVMSTAILKNYCARNAK